MLERIAKAAAAKRLYDAQQLRRNADTEWSAALLGAVKTRIIPDHIANPEPVGTSRVTYADKDTQIALSVAAPQVGIDSVGVFADLAKAKVDPKLLARLSKKHRTETKPAHKFVCSAL